MKNISIVTLIVLLFTCNFAIAQETKNTKKTAETVVVEKRNLTFTKPKNAWQIGVFGGASTLFGDVTPNLFYGNNPALPGHNFGLFVSKSWSYLISTRLRYSTMVMFTTDAVASTLTQNQFSATNRANDIGLIDYTPGQIIFHNSRTQGHDINFDLVFTFGNINYHKERSPIVFRAFPSVGMFMYQSFYDHLDENGDTYNYNDLSNLNDLGKVDRTEILTKLSEMRDGKFETRAEEHSVYDENKLLGYNSRFTFGLGAGMAIRLTDYMSLDIETRQTFVNDDLIDGVKWQEPDGKTAASRNTTINLDSYNQTTLGLTFSLISKKIGEPLCMQNPLWGADAMAKKKDEVKELSDQTDSTNTELTKKIDDLEGDIENLNMLVQMMAKKNAERLEEDKIKEEELKNQGNGLNPNNSDGSTEIDNNDPLNNLDDKTYRHRNGDYIYIAQLDGEIQAAYYVVGGSFRVKSNAKKDQRIWNDKGVTTYLMIDVKDGLYRVILDYTDDHAAALDLLDEYKEKLDRTIWLIKAK